jgi:hypothetical protein
VRADDPDVCAEIADVLRAGRDVLLAGRRRHVEPAWIEAVLAFVAAPPEHALTTWARVVRISRARLTRDP